MNFPKRYSKKYILRGIAAIASLIYFAGACDLLSQQLREPPVYGAQIATDGVVGADSIPIGTAVTIDVSSDGRYVVYPIGHVCEPPIGDEKTNVKSSIAEYVYADESFKNKVSQGLSVSAGGSYGAFSGSASMNVSMSNLYRSQKTSFLFASRIDATRAIKNLKLQFSRHTLENIGSEPTFRQVYNQFGDGVVSTCQTTAAVVVEADLSSLTEETRREITGSMQMNYAQVFSGSVSAFSKVSKQHKREKVTIKAAAHGVDLPDDIPTSGATQQAINHVNDLLNKANKALADNAKSSQTVTSVTLQSAVQVGGYPQQSSWTGNYDRARELRLQYLAAKRALSSLNTVANKSHSAGVFFEVPNFDAANAAATSADQAIEDLKQVSLSNDGPFEGTFESARNRIGSFRTELQRLYDLKLPVTLHANAGFEATAVRLDDSSRPEATVSCDLKPELSMNNLRAPTLAQVTGKLEILGRAEQRAVIPVKTKEKSADLPTPQPTQFNSAPTGTTFKCEGLLQPFGALSIDGVKTTNVPIGEWPHVSFPEAPVDAFKYGLTKPSEDAPLQVTVKIDRKKLKNKHRYLYIYASGKVTVEFSGSVQFADLESIVR